MWNVSQYSHGMMAIGLLTSTVLRWKERPSPTGTVSRAAPPAVRLSSPAKPNPDGLDQGRHARRYCQDSLRKTPTSPNLLKTPRLRHRSVRQEHLGDRNEILADPFTDLTKFFGNLYHLNAEEEPELPDYPTDPAFLAKLWTQRCDALLATDKDDPTTDPRWGPSRQADG